MAGGTRRSKFMRLDDRTGRLERAVNLIEDGDKRGMMTRKAERDLEHPQSRPIKPGIDRGALRDFKPEIEKGTYTYLFGLEGINENSNWFRPQIPCFAFQHAKGTVQYSTGHGYGHIFGYGALGYSGLDFLATTEAW